MPSKLLQMISLVRVLAMRGCSSVVLVSDLELVVLHNRKYVTMYNHAQMIFVNTLNFFWQSYILCRIFASKSKRILPCVCRGEIKVVMIQIITYGIYTV